MSRLEPLVAWEYSSSRVSSGEGGDRPAPECSVCVARTVSVTIATSCKHRKRPMAGLCHTGTCGGRSLDNELTLVPLKNSPEALVQIP